MPRTNKKKAKSKNEQQQEQRLPQIMARLRNGNTEQRTKAADALTEKAACCTQCTRLIIEADAVPALLAIMNMEPMPNRHACNVAACNALATLVSSGGGDDDAETAKLVEQAGALPQLLELVARGTSDEGHAASCVLTNVSVHEERCRALIDADGVESLLSLLARGHTEAKEAAVMALSNLMNAFEEDIVDALAAAGGVALIREFAEDAHASHSGRNAALEMLDEIAQAPGAPVPFHKMCSGVGPPEHLRPEQGYTYPMQLWGNKCNTSCPHYTCITHPEGDQSLDMNDEDALYKWMCLVCVEHNCSPAGIAAVRTLLQGDFVPEDVVVKPKSSTSSGTPEVYAFLVTDDEKKCVFPIDMTHMLLHGKRVCELPVVTNIERRFALGKLSETIEEAAGTLTDAQYKAIYEAAMAVHKAME